MRFAAALAALAVHAHPVGVVLASDSTSNDRRHVGTTNANSPFDTDGRQPFQG